MMLLTMIQFFRGKIMCMIYVAVSMFFFRCGRGCDHRDFSQKPRKTPEFRDQTGRNATTPPIATPPGIRSSIGRIIAVTEAIIVWGINRLLTKLRHPPKFHGSVLFHIVSEAPTQGVLLALVPTLLAVLFIWCWFAENSFTASSDPVSSPSAINFEGITGYVSFPPPLFGNSTFYCSSPEAYRAKIVDL